MNVYCKARDGALCVVDPENSCGDEPFWLWAGAEQVAYGILIRLGCHAQSAEEGKQYEGKTSGKTL